MAPRLRKSPDKKNERTPKATPRIRSCYGADDRIGAANNLDAEIVRAAAALVTEGRVYSLAMETGADTPAFRRNAYALTVRTSTIPAGTNRLTGNDDALFIKLGTGTQIDGLGHAGCDHIYYNGLTAGDIIGPDGLVALGVENIPPLVSRGVVLDIAGLEKSKSLPADYAIGEAALRSAAARQGVRLRKGDVVLLHTGWMDATSADAQTYIKSEPGLGISGARYLASCGVVAVGADNIALEVVPHEDPDTAYPVHQILLMENGIYIMENVVTAAVVKDRVWEFLFVLGVPRLRGAAESVIHPVAIR